MQTEYTLKNRKILVRIVVSATDISEKYYRLVDGDEKLLAETRDDASFAACKVNAEPYNGKGPIEYCYLDEPVVLFDGSPDEYTDMPKLKVGEPLPKVDFSLFDHKKTNEVGHQSISLFGKSKDGDVIERNITLNDDDDFIVITNTLHFTREVDLEFFADYYTFAQGERPDFTWLPHMKYDLSGISPDWTFKCPSVMAQKEANAVALVPDLDFLYEDKSFWYCSAALDLDITDTQGPKMGYGLITSEPRYHSMFIHPIGLRKAIPAGDLTYRYFMFLDAGCPERQIYRRIVKFQWDRFGHKNFLAGHDAQRKSFRLMEKEAWHWVSKKFWIEFDYKGTRCGGFRDYHRGLDDDIWFFGWWNSLRTAYAMEAYARRRKHPETSVKAHNILNLILNAPRKEGVIPAVFLKNEDGDRVWTSGSPSNFGGRIYDYHTYAMTWTAFWLIKWMIDFNEYEAEIMPIVRGLAEFLLKHQRENGFIPSYYREEDLSIDEEMKMNKENAEPAACALFLVEMYKVTGEKKFLDAAEKAVRYVEREIMPENKWFDFETFYSCSPKEFGTFDERTGQYPQCNMALMMMAKVCPELHRIKKNAGYLELGKRVLDYLSLFQQVWSHPRMEPNLVGGFTTQNTDGEWSDSRQSQAAIIFMDYFEETGDLTYLERGIAAMRATLAISPYENYSHRGYNNEPGFFSSFHWGIGTGLTTEEILVEKYGDIFTDLNRGFSYGLNGCTVSQYSFDGEMVELEVLSNISFVEPLTLVFRSQFIKKSISVVVNGEKLGTFDVSELKNGIKWYFVIDKSNSLENGR